MSATEETLEQRTFEVFKRTQERLRFGEARRIDGRNDWDQDLEQALAELDLDSLTDLVRGDLPIRDEEARRKLQELEKSWMGVAADLKLAQLAEPLYLRGQNEKIARMLGDSTITATILDGVTSRPIASLPEEGSRPPVENFVVGTLDHASVGLDGGRLLLRPTSEGPDVPSAWNVQPIDPQGNPLVTLGIEATPAQP